MSGHDGAQDALRSLLAELPAEFSHVDPATMDRMDHRTEFRVIKRSNVRRIHEAIWELREYLGLDDD